MYGQALHMANAGREGQSLCKISKHGEDGRGKDTMTSMDRLGLASGEGIMELLV
jgi:hypothetical protein